MGAQAPPADISGSALPQAIPLVLWSLPEPPRLILTQEDVDAALTQVMEEHSAAAVSVATVERGQLSQAGAWGWAVKNQQEMTPDTKVRVASISKVVVAMCAMSMADEGLIDLDAPLSDYWGSGVRNPYSEVQPSVRTLMTHTSSLRNLEITRGLSHLRGLLQRPSTWRSMEPGNGGYWYYSNFGLCVLGTTLELACGGLLENYLQEHFLQPLGASASFYSETLEAGQLAALYTTGGVGRSVAEQMAQTTPTQIGQGASYFPGGFTASAYGVFALMTYNPETRNGVVVLTTGAPRNTDDRGLYALCADLSEKLYEKMDGDPI